MSSRVLQGDVFDVLPTIQAGSVDCVVTSPPYWMLRSYLPKDHPLKSRELGSEPTPGEYVANQVKVFRLVRDCLADHGTVWLNIGDSYAGGGNGIGSGKQLTNPGSHVPGRTTPGLENGNLVLIPQRLAIALQDDGWLVRSVVIWHKPSAMPASLAGWMWVRHRLKVKEGVYNGRRDPRRGEIASSAHHPAKTEWSDCPGCKKCEPHNGYVLRRGSWRPTSSYEPILMLAKKQGYYADGIAVETPAKSSTTERDKYTRVLDDPDEEFAVQHDHETASKTANLRDVWTIAAESLKEKHYAAFPTELVRLCLKAGTSEKGYCPACGKPWARVVEVSGTTGRSWHDHEDDEFVGQRTEIRADTHNPDYRKETLGWRPTCRCPAHEPRPALVLDPFAGSGRTGVTAQRMFLDFVGVELNEEYCRLAQRILRDDCPLFS